MGNSGSTSKRKKGKGNGGAVETPATTPVVSSSSNPPPPISTENKGGSQSNITTSTTYPAKVDPKPSPAKSNSSKSESDKAATFSLKRLEETFEKYKEADNQQIGPEGIEALCRDIGVEPENVVVLVLAWHLNAQSMGYFRKEEFINGLQTLGVDTVDKLKSHLNIFKNELDDPLKYKEIYRYAFGFAKEKEQKILDLATADGMLDLLMGGRFPHTEKLRQFMKEQTTYKSVNLDQWMNILEFCRTIKADLSNYDENGAWPVLLDEYCEWALDR